MDLRLTLTLILVACNPLVVEPNTPNPPPARDAVPCADACARLASLACEESKPTPDGTTCVEICEGIEDSGVVRYPTGCVAAAKSCADAVECE
jgi:hypothetical protein